jgi:hypothetical protein
MEDFAAQANTQQANLGKFQDPHVTAKGEARASVALTKPETLWFNTGTLLQHHLRKLLYRKLSHQRRPRLHDPRRGRALS